jgi:DNA-binding MarR family transcriptional regulator
MSVPLIGQGYRGVEGRSGFLLRQASHAFGRAMDEALAAHGLSPAQYSALSVLARDPGVSGADLARGCNTTPQAMNGVLATLEREGLVERHPHPTHGRILQVELTSKGRRRLDQAQPSVRGLEAAIEEEFSAKEMEAVKRWLVATAERLPRTTVPKRPERGLQP